MRVFAVALAVLTGGYMVVDGAELGPWAALLRAAGVTPVSRPVEFVFVTIGTAWLAAAILLARGRAARLAAFASVATLWYLPFGTLVALFELWLVATRRVR